MKFSVDPPSNNETMQQVQTFDALKTNLNYLFKAEYAGENQHKFFSMLIPIQNQCWVFVNWFTNKLWMVDQQGKTRLTKESKIKNIALSQDSAHSAIRLEKPATPNLYKLSFGYNKSSSRVVKYFF